MHLSSLPLLVLALSIGAAAQAQTGAPLAAGPEKATTGLRVTVQEPFGEYLTDTEGRAVYIFSKDKDDESLCAGPCLEGWPPVRAAGQANAGQGVAANRIGSIEQGGGRQMTYDKHPLYYYKQDGASRATSGQAAFSYDGDWYLLSPSGEPIKAKRPGVVPQER